MTEVSECGLKYEAFVCEIGESHVMIFDPMLQLIRVPKQNFIDKIELGQFYVPNYNQYAKIRFFHDEPHVFVKEGTVHAKVLASAPVLGNLSEDNRKKYKRTAWSALLQLLDDPQNLFFDFPHNEVALATVKYVPNGKTVFEVVAVEEPTSEFTEETFDGRQASAPWLIEEKEALKHVYAQPPSSCLRFQQTKVIAKSRVFYGVVLERVRGRGFKGNEQEIEYIYSWSEGIMRAIDRNLNLGTWVKFQVRDNRARGGVTEGTVHLKKTTVGNCTPIDEVVPTRLISIPNVSEPVVEMTVSFVFDHDMLEPIENRSKKDWEVRRHGLKLNAHFYDVALGRIEVYPVQSRTIIENIERHRKILESEDPALFEQLKNEKIAVEVKVQPFRTFRADFASNQAAAVFRTWGVGRISYLIGGRPIKGVA